MTAQRRDDTERALVVAPFGDLDVRVVFRRRHQARRVRVIEIGRQRVRRVAGRHKACPYMIRDAVGRGNPCGCPAVKYERGRGAADRVDDVRHLAGAEDRVDFRDLLLQFIAMALGEASGDDEPAAGAVSLVPRHLENRVD